MKAFVVNKVSDDIFKASIEELDIPSCEEEEVIIKVSYSSVNYKDALSFTGNKGVTRKFPHITGIDLAGNVYKSKSKLFKEGQRVLVTGYDLGMNTNGGHSQYVKVPSSWIVKSPENLSDKELMSYGTAGLTAALSVNELVQNNINPKDGAILVSGSSGGVGTVSIAILNKLGYEVIAISSKKDKIPYLKSIGAKEVIGIDEFLEDSKKPLLSSKYAGIIDTVGGDILSVALKSLNYDGVATCCGLVSSTSLETSIFPFILRGIRLIGIDSVECKIEKKQEIWEKIANEWKIENLDKLVNEIRLEDLEKTYKLLLEGKAVGRYVVNIATK